MAVFKYRKEKASNKQPSGTSFFCFLPPGFVVLPTKLGALDRLYSKSLHVVIVYELTLNCELTVNCGTVRWTGCKLADRHPVVGERVTRKPSS